MTSCKAASMLLRVNVSDSGTAIPEAETSRCALVLSMHSAEESTLQPTTGIPES